MKKLIFIVILLGILVISFTACSDGGSPESQDAGFKVGAVLSLTGQYSAYGTGVEKGLNIAISETNAQGGVNGNEFIIDIEDTGSTVEGALLAFNKLADAGYKVIIGPETTELCEKLIPQAVLRKIILISPSASAPSLAKIKSYGYFFRICPSDQSEALQMVSDISRELRRFKFIKRAYKRTLVLVRKDNKYTEEMWRALGTELNSKREMEYEKKIFVPEDLEIGNESIEEILHIVENYRRSGSEEEQGVVVILGFADDVKKMLTVLKDRFWNEEDNSMNLEIYATSAVDTNEFFEGAVDVSSGLIFPRMFNPSDTKNEIVKLFVDQYNAAHQTNPDLFAAYGYDAGKLMALTKMRDGIEDVMDEPYTFRMHMNDIGFIGVTGKIDFQQQTGEVAKTPTLFRMKEFGVPVTVPEYESELISEAMAVLENK